MTLPVPDFRALDSRIDDRLNEILHCCLSRELKRRYADADKLLYDLEHYIYHTGYGPTNETLGKYIRELFGQFIPPTVTASDNKGGTQVLEPTARVRSKT
jgi:serine/threonine-protein kinase